LGRGEGGDRLTPRERWLALLRGEPADRVLCDFWATGEVIGRLLRDLGCATERELWKRLGVDKCIHLSPRHPAAREDTWHTPSHFSLWGVETRTIAYGEGIGEYAEDAFHPLGAARSVADVEQFSWPDPDGFDTAGLRAEAAQWPDYPILGAASEPFYLYCRLRGMEQALEDLVANPEIAEAILERIYDFDSRLIRRVLTELAGTIDIVYVAEDLGTQNHLLMSPAAFRRHLKPRMTRLIEMIHSFGVKVYHHDDGAIRPLLPDLIEAGIDLLNPVQWRCRGMEREGLARDFGGAVVFHGGIDNQHTLPFGTPEDVRRQVRENLEIFRGGRGYIVAPCHNIQPNTPTENIVALYEAVREFNEG
jgi:uroporphyrinogen decarboxylase